ncbi:unnamed protein product, partial [Urochloa humidicola]
PPPVVSTSFLLTLVAASGFRADLVASRWPPASHHSVSTDLVAKQFRLPCWEQQRIPASPAIGNNGEVFNWRRCDLNPEISGAGL